MATLVAGLLFFGVAMQSAGALNSQTASCAFSIVHRAPEQVSVAGPAEVLSRLRIMRQPDSPVLVAGMDFTASELEVVDGSYTSQLRGRIELMNLSDREVRDVQLRVYVRAINGSVGVGPRPIVSIAPGAHGVIENLVHKGHGSGHIGDIFVDVVVESMTIGDCLHRPSQTQPFLRVAGLPQ